MSTDDQFIEPDFIEPDVPVSGGGNSNVSNGNDNAVSGLSGTMDVAGGLNRGTLDESVAETLKRDVYDINSKLKQVVYPHLPSSRYMAAGTEDSNSNNSSSDELFNSSDFWAPLAFIILYSVCVSHAKTLFSSIFVSSWFVLLVMALHLKLTKPYQNASLLSYISLSGYCLFPLVLNALMVQIVLPAIFHAMGESHWKVRVHTVINLVCFAFCFIWSFSCSAIVTRSKGFVQLYPLALCLFGLGWLSVIL
ncbi:Protein YIP4 [Nakaseomyces bracarensis]|uniref:Protein YIP4 n=1 Tax=Nakaseomyces bracarensis TaxID=273131 RepID=A0ABR4NMH6_9SACH